MESKILKLKDVISTTGFKRSTIYIRIKDGLLTEPVKIGKRAVGWPHFEIQLLIKASIAGFDENEIKLLVKNLEARRKIDIESLLTWGN